MSVDILEMEEWLVAVVRDRNIDKYGRELNPPTS